MAPPAQERPASTRAASARRGLHAAAPLMLMALVAGQCGNDDLDDAHDTRVATMRIVPASVQALENQSFSLEVRLWDAQGHALAVDPTLPPKWRSSDPTGLAEQVTDGGRGVFLAARAGTAIVSVRVGTITAQASVTITADPATGTSDVVQAPHLPGNAPAWAVVRGARGATAVYHEIHAFARRASIADLDAGLQTGATDSKKGPDVTAEGSVVLLSRAARTTRAVTDWHPGRQTVDYFLTGGGTGDVKVQLAPPLTVTVRAWDATTAGGIDLLDLELATGIFSRNPSGIVFAAEGDAVGRLVTTSATENDCADPGALMRLASNPDQTPFDPAKAELHVAYVQDLGGWNGWACRPDPDPAKPARLIMVAANRHATTLAHELGHTLGLRQPSNGHINCVRGLDQSNVMFAGVDATHQAGRTTFSIGQAFRMRYDAGSWVSALLADAGGPLACAAQDAAGVETESGPCPRLSAPYTLSPAYMPCGGL